MARKTKIDIGPGTRLTKYELARILGARALQLSMGAPPLVEADAGDRLIDIARAELEERTLPVIVRRRMPDGQIVDIPLLEATEEEKEETE